MTPRRIFRDVRCRGFEVIEYAQPAGLRIPRHFHSDATLLMVTRGEVTDTFGGRTERTEPGSFLLRPSGAPHTHRYGSTDTHCVSLSMEPRWLSEITDRRLGEDFVIGRGRISFARLVREMSMDDAVRPFALESIVVELLMFAGKTRALGETYRMPPWLSRARDLLHDPSRGRLSLEDAAKEAGVHAGHLTRAFRAHFGCSIGQYARGVRIRSAARALIESDRPIADVALEAGFYDQSHFHRVFQRTVGATPGRWRLAHGRSGSPAGPRSQMRGSSNLSAEPHATLRE